MSKYWQFCLGILSLGQFLAPQTPFPNRDKAPSCTATSCFQFSRAAGGSSRAACGRCGISWEWICNSLYQHTNYYFPPRIEQEIIPFPALKWSQAGLIAVLLYANWIYPGEKKQQRFESFFGVDLTPQLLGEVIREHCSHLFKLQFCSVIFLSSD